MLSKLNAFNIKISIIFICLIFILILSQIILRLFNLYIPSVNEICGYFLVSSFFLALGYSVEQDKHIRVSLIFEFNNPKLSHLAQLSCYSTATLIALFICYACFSLAYDSYLHSEVSSGELAILEWPIQAVILYGCVVATLTIIKKATEVMRGFD